MESPSAMTVDAKVVLERCATLASISEMELGILRQYLTNEHKLCNQQVAVWMREAGMTTWQDAVGNQWGRLASSQPDAPRLILGSHLDTVPNAGAYDGILGVLLAVQAAAKLNQNQKTLPFHLDVVGFADEEGTRFPTTLIGSRALAGNFEEHWLQLRDKSGISMSEAMVDFGLEPQRFSEASLQNENPLAYWEVHIEQGPVLEAQGLPVGVVTGIAGARRFHASFTGQAGHAGTTPMELRKDALTAASEFVLMVEKLARATEGECVATVGNLQVRPGAENVIAGYASVTLDVRSQDDAKRDALVDQIVMAGEGIALARDVAVGWEWRHAAPAVHCCEHIQGLFAKAIEQLDVPVLHLPSGAGHDAMALAGLTEIGMLFIRSPGGISHHPKEDVLDGDVALALQVLCDALLAQSAILMDEPAASS